MSESGQPGAPTPGEHGDGTGRQDDLARDGSGWAPPATGWARSAEGPGVWPRPETTSGWAASSPRHGDLPAPLPGLPAEEPPSRVNGRHVNGVPHAGDEPPAPRQAPVSAPPLAEPRRETDGDRLAVPAQRPAPAVEQPPAEAEAGPAWHVSDDPPAGRRWAEGAVPSSAPPALQVPPVGAAASGFEVPPGFHAPTVDRAAAEPPPSLPQGWADRVPGEPPPQGWVDRVPTEPPGEPSSQGWVDRVPAEPPPSLSHGWADRPGSPPPAGPVAERELGPTAERRGPAEEPRAAATDDRHAGPAGERGPSPAEESDWSGPSRTRPSWGGGWAPRWDHEDEPAGRRAGEDEPAGRRAREDEPVGRRVREDEPVGRQAREDEPVGRRARAEHLTEWAPESARSSEAPRAEAQPAYEPGARETRERPSWAGPPVPVHPYSAPPTSAPPVPREASAGGQPPGYDPASAGGQPTAYDPARFDRASAADPVSASSYTARRAAPEPLPPAEPVADTRPAEPAPVVLPQRVPAEPDVPVVPEPPAAESTAETPELARIATHLRRDDEPAPLRERPEGFDVNAILDAVREVPGVRDAALRRTPAGAHSLRLDLADGADPAEVSRVVARLLQERMGLAAAPQNLPGTPAVPPPPVRRRSARRTAEDRPAARPAPSRAAENRPAENRAGEGRFGTSEARTGRVAEAPEGTEPTGEPPRRRRQAAIHRGRAAVEESSLAAAPAAGAATGSPATLGTSYSGGQMTTTETAPSRPLDTGGAPGPRVVIDHVLVSTFGLDATVEVRLIAGDRTAEGHSTGPAVDGYVLRLCAVAAAAALDELLGRAAPNGERGRCFVEHTAVVPFGNCEVATVVVLLVCDGWVEQLAGSALVAGDPRQAVVRATLAAVNRRLEALLS
ncbi:hypothetical protein GA0074695_0977 [Micromonospora viridifaciens]|uniref:Uncharacterized protein n=1 Tax=Micromonospora viridifaciens TaxID=1881 RepID=A0A1C4UZF1_MICVI|nr:hypothetical protein GA0074695_0977 [Micromonospora viridifaciens]